MLLTERYAMLVEINIGAVLKMPLLAAECYGNGAQKHSRRMIYPSGIAHILHAQPTRGYEAAGAESARAISRGSFLRLCKVYGHLHLSGRARGHCNGCFLLSARCGCSCCFCTARKTTP